MLAIGCPPFCRRHRLGVRDHIGLGEDSLALLVRGQLELRLGDTVRDLLEECLLLGVGAVGAELADERGRVGRLADLVAQAAVEYVRIPTYSIFC